MNHVEADDATERGQMAIDFVVGVSIFLLTIAFVVAFVPQMFAPYQDQEHPVVSERITVTLADDLLSDPGAPSALNETCTVSFLTQDSGAPAGCPDTSTTIQRQVGVESYHAVNVTLKRAVGGGTQREILCETNGSIGACGSERLAVGPPVPTHSRSVATSRRTVVVNGTDALLEVSVW